MDYAVISSTPAEQVTSCAIIGIFDSRSMTSAATAFDKASGGAVSAVLDRGDLDGKKGQHVLLGQLNNCAAERVLLVGCGKKDKFDETAYRTIVTAAIKAVKQTGATDACIYLSELSVTVRDAAWNTRNGIEAIEQSAYCFNKMKRDTNDDDTKLNEIFMVVSSADIETASIAMDQGLAIAKGMSLSKDLGNLPANICTPTYLSKQAIELAAEVDKLSTEILEDADMEALGMGSLLSVGRGSREDSKLIVMNYQGGDTKSKPIVLVGKGVTFDSGGISLKPGAGMDEMKYDMCGAASVFGTMKAITDLELPINVIGIVPSVENMPDGIASKPGDIVTAMDGTTIEILNTDAEGRLILCDALTYAAQFEPACIVDIATLTGAIIIALGRQPSGLFSNSDDLATELSNAGDDTLDRAWRLPLYPEYKDQLKSNFADLANIGGRDAGSITAATFLAHFTQNQQWAHLDIAGTAWNTGGAKGATGRPVPLLTQFILNRC